MFFELLPRLKHFMSDPRDKVITELEAEAEDLAAVIAKRDSQITFLMCHLDLDMRLKFNQFIMLSENKDKTPAQAIQPFLDKQMLKI